MEINYGDAVHVQNGVDDYEAVVVGGPFDDGTIEVKSEITGNVYSVEAWEITPIT